MTPAPRAPFFVTCPPGVEDVLHGELRALRLAKVERQVGGCYFEGTLADAWRANLELRTAVRVLMRVARFQARDADALRAGVGAVDWRRFLGPEGSLAVQASASHSALDHTLFIAQCAKDAVVDQLRTAEGARPSVDKDDPDLRLHVHLVKDRCTVLADTSGDALHLRGWRVAQGRAPLAENLAAACVLLSEWDRRAPLLDPFCGSGTLLVEGGLLAADIAPGSFRERFGFERWPGHDAAGWRALREAARARARVPARPLLHGQDVDPKAVEGARANLAAAGLERAAELRHAELEAFAPRKGWGAWIVTNPPYGERVGDRREALELHRRLGAILRERCAGFRVALLSGDPSLTRALGLEPRARRRVLNGGLECELLLFAL